MGIIKGRAFDRIWWGDGLASRLIKMSQEFRDPVDSVFKKRLTIEPWNRLIDEHKIKKIELDEKGFMIVDIPVDWILTLSESPANRLKLIFCDLRGNPTPLTNHYKELSTQIRVLWKEIDRERAAKAGMFEKLENACALNHAFSKWVRDTFDILGGEEKKDEKDNVPMPIQQEE